MLHALFKPRPLRVLSTLISQEKKNGKLHVLQIGANDGVMADPLSPLLTRFPYLYATRVEPIKEYYFKLTKTCSEAIYSNRVKCINAAISETDGTTTMILPAKPQQWQSQHQGLARLKNVSINNGQDESKWREVAVPSMQPTTLLKQSISNQVDIYISDCEGFDIDLLGLMPLQEMGVRAIYIEVIQSAFTDSSDAGTKLGKAWQILGAHEFNQCVWDGFNLLAWKSPPAWASNKPSLLPGIVNTFR